ncbi:MAG: TPM domain-containing protein [Bacteroidia bacterium]
MGGARSFFAPDQVAAIKEAVVAAEIKTSGEVRVFIESNCKDIECLDRAADVFDELHLQKTAQRNGVLFYLAVDDHKFAILGDAGINKIVPANFWDSVKEHMQTRFRKGEFTEGLVEGIGMAGEKLITHFPGKHDDINELEDDVIFGE